MAHDHKLKMGPPHQLSFTVPTGDVCVLCLKKCSSGSTGATKYVSFQAVSHYLNLDIKEIFNIKREFSVGGGGGGDDGEFNVDVDVMLCKSCWEWRKAFDTMFKEYKTIQRRLNASVRGMHDVMVKGERSVENVRDYLKIVGDGSKSLQKVKGSIPEKFRREVIGKSHQKGMPTKGEESEPDKKKAAGDNLLCNEKVISSDAEDEDEEYDQFEAEFLMAEGGSDGADGINVGDTSSPSEAQYPSEDEDDDPEELMMKYNSMAESGAQDSDEFEEEEDPLSNVSTEYMEDEMEADGGIMPGPSSSTASSPKKVKKYGRPGTYGGQFECDLCGKVVVSLKNFELHQRRHAGEKPFECEYCEKTFRDTSNLRSHVLRYHRHFIFIKFKSPDVSMKQFQDGLDTLIQSILTSTTADENSSTRVTQGCHLCKRFYTQRHAIEDHIVQRHYDVLGMSIATLQKEIDTLTRDECLFLMTQMMSEGSTARMCGSCGETFDSAEELNVHVKTHIKVNLVRNKPSASTPSPPAAGGSLIKLKMKCEPCGRYFEDLTALTKHKNSPLTHGGCCTKRNSDALFQCEHCGKCLNTSNSRRRHLLSLHRYQVFSKYLPPGYKPVEVEDMIKHIFESRKTERAKEGFKCFLCEKFITQYRKLSSHVLVSHFNEVVSLVRKGLRERRMRNGGEDPGEVVEVDMDDIEVIEIDSEDENDDAPKILHMLDYNGEEIEGRAQLEPNYASGRDVEYIMDKDANIVNVNVRDPQIKIEYGVSYS